MPKPVPVPSGPLVVTDADIARAEMFLAALAEVLEYGTSGGSLVTEAMTVPDSSTGADPTTIPPIPFVLDTETKQLFYRQIAHALARSLAAPASSTQLGVTALSSPPSDPATPVALNAEEVRVVAGANLVPRANSSGILDPSWGFYTPAAPDNWASPAPASIAGALDRLAAAFAGLALPIKP